MIFCTIATWVLTPLLINIYGFNGVSIASAIVTFSAILVIALVKKYIEFSLLRAVGYPLISAFFMRIVLYFLAPGVITNFPTLILMFVISIMVYFLLSFPLSIKQTSSNITLLNT